MRQSFRCQTRVCLLSLLIKTLLFQLRLRHNHLQEPIPSHTGASTLRADHYHNKSPASAITTVGRTVFPHQHLNKAGKDALCSNPRKLAKERRWTGSLYVLCSSCRHWFNPKWRTSFPIFKYKFLLVFQKYNINHSTCFPLIPYDHHSLVYWNIIGSSEAEVRVTVLEYWFTEN